MAGRPPRPTSSRSGVALPTTGAAIAGIRFFGDFERFAAISEATADKLMQIERRIELLLAGLRAASTMPRPRLAHEIDMTSSSARSKAGKPCPAAQAHRIAGLMTQSAPPRSRERGNQRIPRFPPHSRADQKQARLIVRALEAARLPGLVGRTARRPGERFSRDRSRACLENARAVVVLWSKTSTGSHWVHDEATRGRRRATGPRSRSTAAFRRWASEQFESIDVSHVAGQAKQRADAEDAAGGRGAARRGRAGATGPERRPVFAPAGAGGCRRPRRRRGWWLGAVAHERPVRRLEWRAQRRGACPSPI